MSTEGEQWRKEELFAYFFGIYIKFGNKNPSILAPSDSVDVATIVAVEKSSVEIPGLNF